ncbi:glycosyltransferase family 2 protein [Asticcacaulis excentricus]|uniref:Glycosyl transferase family 2 n=1 Tax=Asticcacaulis excentricus (strain ATCC 15261 / DSM 4724 / KCTC 12464 / NCIMB 9791 / VKM B-1370 / CB 48) TaxID=573065 RepID=E8RTH1_ASTEC|nr:glycosyltransferase family 2 protein [Asticcacaulis excentricus]ADU14792.1 glycosyl transferase family 2 [Asticcacaulis excentricus CB 48]
MTATVVTNAAREAAPPPRLSVLIPFYKESPATLLRALTPTPGVEIVLLDDGSGQAELTQEVMSTIDEVALPATFLSLTHNEGRARGRNRLTQAARGDYFLCLDSDMLPDAPDFLTRWLEVMDDNPAVVFGGFSLLQAPMDKRFAIHRMMAAKSDCLNAATRALMSEKYVFTSNLLIRRDVFATQDFDSSFTGWGWEDVEWAMRVAQQFGVQHIDNPATHLGLDTADTLMRKYEQSVGNFARVVDKHPQVVATYASYRAARLIRKLPLRGALRATLRGVIRNEALPLKARAFGLRLYRAALYSEVV